MRLHHLERGPEGRVRVEVGGVEHDGVVGRLERGGAAGGPARRAGGYRRGSS